ncbi:hypothetical protein MG293_011125 [Ovis ammon polii]|uniref:Uncharacterized protein n=1 Tax=Ovis ammon polii TaxID=230172 RepID=A0AAD4Y8W4_OVIAM|nr:hypothetical protein MG293_011125 [Ovis ammon polii]KAI4565275.1 hypothetical protein MJT46_009618 [Ovis ammon polii x Ovis aries]
MEYQLFIYQFEHVSSADDMSFPLFMESDCLTAAAAAAAAATNAAIAEAMKVKKIKLEAMSNYHASNSQHGADSENGDMNSSVGLELPFMMMPHPLIPVSLPPASVTMAMSQMNHLSTIANMAAAAQVQSPPSRVETSVIKRVQSDCTAGMKGLLKVAIDNARAQEKQVQLEKTELKMDFLRERELRETLEKQLAMEQKNRDSLTPEIEADRSGGRTDAERTIQGIHVPLDSSIIQEHKIPPIEANQSFSYCPKLDSLSSDCLKSMHVAVS